jgi:hypothetical protein
MFSNITQRKEGFLTLLTFVGLLSSVDPFMYCKVTRRTKDFSTLLLYEGFLFNVRAFMYLRGKRIIEVFPTLLTFMASLSTVSSINFLKMWKTGGFFFYSYVHTRLGSFLPPAPTPSLTTHSTPSLSPHPLNTQQKLFCPYF